MDAPARCFAAGDLRAALRRDLLPGRQGGGAPADDIYAPGVLLLLALCHVPLPDLDDAAILQRKLDLGIYAALVGQERLCLGIAKLVKAMLAEDPDHRPLAASLLHPPAARAHRVAARPSRRAQRPLEIGGVAIWTARQAAYVLATNPVQGIPALRNGQMDDWLRHGLADAGMGLPG